MVTEEEAFWSARYAEGTTGWDIGYPSPPLKNYIDQLHDRSLSILLPGAGNAYEAEYLWNNGYQNITILDISKLPLQNLRLRMPAIPENKLVHEDFFLHEGAYDLILEQTFFCAIHPSFRQNYAAKMAALLRPEGRLAGVLFDAPMNADRPPYGGSAGEYRKYFDPYFKFCRYESCKNSIAPRAGTELFIELEKKKA